MILQGDCLIKLKELEDNSVDSIVTDPPYGIGFMGKEWDTYKQNNRTKSQVVNMGAGMAFPKVAELRAFQDWCELWAKECLRVLKPGGHLLSFGGTRTYHRMACAIEDAGFEVRDMIEWVYSTGFPKSHNVWKQLKKNCTCGIMDEYERTQKIPESLVRYMSETDVSQTITNPKTEGEVLQSGLSEQSISVERGLSKQIQISEGGEKSSLEGWSANETNSRELSGNNLPEMSEGISTNGEERRIHNATQTSDGSTLEPITDENGSSASHRPQSEEQQDREPCAFCKQSGTQALRTFGVGSALKPAHEPICFSRKPLEKGLTIAENCLRWGTGGINIDESRVGEREKEQFTGKKTGSINAYGDYFYEKSTEPLPPGRFPANLIHDNSEEVRECFPDTKSAGGLTKNVPDSASVYGKYGVVETMKPTDSGNASRFFKSIIYQAKASKSERNAGCEWLEEKQTMGGGGMNNTEDDVCGKYGSIKAPAKNNHPTVKPIALMAYLIKMVTPKGGIVLDPFAGSGTTLVAAKQNGFQFIGIEMEEEYIKIAEARINGVEDTLFN